MEKRGIRTERGGINRAILKANAEIAKINAAILKLENELQEIIEEQEQDELKQIHNIPTPPQKAAKVDSVKKPTAKPTPIATAKANPVLTPKAETKIKSTPTIKSTTPPTKTKPIQNPKTPNTIQAPTETKNPKTS